MPHQDMLGIAEGIETALSASILFNVPVWAALTAGLLEEWTPPATVTTVFVFGDNDASSTGQAAAYTLAQRLKAKGLSVFVEIPHRPVRTGTTCMSREAQLDRGIASSEGAFDESLGAVVKMNGRGQFVARRRAPHPRAPSAQTPHRKRQCGHPARAIRHADPRSDLACAATAGNCPCRPRQQSPFAS